MSQGPTKLALSIVSFVGIAISSASFVENLAIGRAAIEGVVAVSNHNQFLLFLLDRLHAVVEGWRAAVEIAFSSVGISIPKLFHDIIAVVVFGGLRVWRRKDQYQAYHGAELWWRLELFLRVVWRVFFKYVIPMVALFVVDRALFPDPTVPISPLGRGLIGGAISLFTYEIVLRIVEWRASAAWAILKLSRETDGYQDALDVWHRLHTQHQTLLRRFIWPVLPIILSGSLLLSFVDGSMTLERLGLDGLVPLALMTMILIITFRTADWVREYMYNAASSARASNA